mgnify:CR=1 FL=1
MESYGKLKAKFQKKITTKFFRLFSSLNWFEIIPPYEYVQIINEFNVHRYIGIEKNEILSWVIVGGYLGNEVPRILRNYPKTYIKNEYGKITFDKLAEESIKTFYNITNKE